MTLPAGEPKLEKAAGLPPEPLRDLMALGGWKELQTAVKAYQQDSLERRRQALSRRQRLG